MTTKLKGLSRSHDLGSPLRKHCEHGYRRWVQPSRDAQIVAVCPVCPPMNIYVASSWRNNLQAAAVVHTLRAAGAEVYGFKNPSNATEFKWADVDLVPWMGTQDNQRTPMPYEGVVEVDKYLDSLEHPRAEEGFASDFAAMQAADIMVLVLPCGRSAHLKLGWAVGAGKRTAVLLDDPVGPELMYKMVDYLATDLMDLLGWLGVED